MDWYQIEAKADKTAKINIHDQIGEGWDGKGTTARKFIQDLDALNVDTISLHINSPGGSVFDGVSIYNALKAHKAKINVVVDGIAASIASVIAMAGDKITMPEAAMMMIHDPSGFVMGNAAAMRKTAEALDKIKGSIVTAYMTRSKEDQDKVENMMADTTWLSAKEAVHIGFADEILPDVKAQNFAFEAFNHMANVPDHLINICNQKQNKKETEPMEMTLEKIKSEYPDIAKALANEGKIEGMKEGAQAERDRIAAVRAQALPGHERLIEDMVNDGTTTGEQAAVRILQAEKQIRADIKANLDADTKELPKVPPSNPPENEPKVDVSTEAGMKAAWEKDKSLREEFGEDFETFKAYQQAEKEGRFKVLGGMK
jgi:ATP-dependent Clp protease protease subunit